MTSLYEPIRYECARLRRERLERLGHLCNDYALDMAANRGAHSLVSRSSDIPALKMASDDESKSWSDTRACCCCAGAALCHGSAPGAAVE